MSELFNSWQFNIIGYIIFVVIFSHYFKLAVKNTTKDGASTILLQVIGGVSILLLAPFLPLTWPTDPKFYFLILAACVFYALNDRVQTTARKHLQVSQYAILDRLSVVFVIIIGFTFFQNPLVLEKVIGIVLVLAGNVLLLMKGSKFVFNKYVAFSVLATLCFAIGVSIDIGISKNFNLPIYIMLTLLIPTLMIALTEKISPQVVLAQFTGKAKKYYLITGISWGLFIFFLLRAYQLGQVTIVASIWATSVLANVSVAYFFSHERDHTLRKIIAAVITVIGVIFTVMK